MSAWHTRVDHCPKRGVVTTLFHWEGEMSRNIFKSGNGLVVTLPKNMLAYLQLGEGDEVHLRLDPERRQIVIKPTESPAETSTVDLEFAGQVANFIKLLSRLETTGFQPVEEGALD
ncbi:MAG: AbrB/MazE/SpoVT family DNA-binding domain-containing protein [Anaerolineales bacterium]